MNDKIREIEILHEQFMHAVNHRDIPKIQGFYTKSPKFIPYYSEVPQYGPVPENRWTPEYIGDYWKGVFEITQGGFKYVQPVKEVQVLGTAVYQIGVYDLRMSNEAEEIEEGTYFRLWKKERSVWKIAVHINSSPSQPKWGKANNDRQ